jgi:hypothetical protein
MASQVSIADKIWRLEKQKIVELRKYEEKIKQINCKIKQVRDLCQHKKTRFCLGTPYDPSYYECIDCGKEI